MPAQTYSAPAWGASPFVDLDVPSGGKIQVKRLDFMDIAAADMIDAFDSLSPIVEEKVVGPARGKKPTDRPAKKPTKAQQKKAEEAAGREFLKSDSLANVIKIMSTMLPLIVVQPSIVSDLDADGEKIPFDEREEGLVYVDSIPLGDRMAIFAWMMEDMDMDALKQFRQQSESPVGDVESSEGDGGAAE